MFDKHIIQEDIKRINELFLYTLKFIAHTHESEIVKIIFDVTDDVIDFIQNLSLSDIEKIANLKIPILKSRITNSEINEIKRALNNKRERITKQLLLNCLLKQ